MTAVTATSPLRLGPLAVYSRQIASRLPHIDFVLVALVVLFGGLYLYSPADGKASSRRWSEHCCPSAPAA